MISREELLLKIRSVDQEMNDLIARNPSMQVAYNPAAFPWGALIITTVCGAAYLYGAETVPGLAQYRDYAMYATGVFGVLTVLLLLRWLANLGKRSNKGFREGTARLAELRKQKAILQAQLQSTK